MLITRLVLERFKRTSVVGIENVDIHFNQPYQVILGTNGGGKSSIKKQLIPSVPDKNDFHPGGRKELHLRAHGKQYVLMSSFTKKGSSHDFFVEGENLNNGGTATVQRDLIREHFALTPLLINVLLGDKREYLFSSMSKERRKEVFTHLAPTDLDFANKTYKQLQSVMRDTVGVISYLKGRIGQEQIKLISDEEVEGLTKELKDRELIRSLLLEKKGEMSGMVSAEPIDVDARIHAMTKAIEETRKIKLKDYRYRSLEEMNDAINTLRVEVGVLEEERKGKMLNLEKITRLHGMENGADYSKLESEITTLEAELSLANSASIEKLIYQPGYVEVYHRHASDFNHILTELRHLYELGHDYSHSAYTQHTESLQMIQGQHDRAKQTLHTLHHRLEAADIAQSVDCPQCDHSFKLGIKPGEEEEVRERINKGVGVINQLTRKAGELQGLIDACNEQRSLLSRLYELGRIPEFSAVVQALFNANIATMVDSDTYRILEAHETTQAHLALVTRMSHRLTKLHEMKEYVDSLNALTGGDIHGTYKALEAGIADIGTRMTDAQQRIRVLQQDINDITHLMKVNERVQEVALPAIEKGLEDRAILALIREVDTLIEDNQRRITTISSRLDESNVANRLLAELTTSLAEKEQEHGGYEVLLEELSPKSGLIAEQVSGFVELFTESMNRIIEQVFSYDLRIIPCGLAEGELNYLFPFIAQNGEPAEDVSSGSDGQQELFDFVFMLTVNLMLNQDLPLWLDELGAYFDDYHRNRVMELTKSLIHENTSMVFWISQRATDFIGSNNSEVLVLGTGNVSLPMRYNQHATLS